MDDIRLPEFKVLKKTIGDDGSILYTVQSKAISPTCPNCQSKLINKHSKTTRFVRDLSSFGHQVGLDIEGYRYKCLKCGKVFSEEYDSVEPRSKITTRLKEYIQAESLRRPFAQIAEEFGLSIPTVRNIFMDHVELMDRGREFLAPKVLGIDEVHLNHEMRAIFVDIENLRILEMTKTRSKAAVAAFLSIIPNNEKIQVVSIDMHRPYLEAVYDVLPNAKVVIDKFHVVEYANSALNKIRIAMKDNLSPSERRKLKRDRYLMLRNAEDLSDEQIETLEQIFMAYPQFETAYQLKEEFRKIYQRKTRFAAENAFETWIDHIPDDMTELLELAHMVMRWRIEIFNYFDYPYTNAASESVNNLIKHIMRAGRGYNFDVLRAKTLYGTKATKRPKYTKPDTSSSMGMITGRPGGSSGHRWQAATLTEGFGVDILELTKILEQDGFGDSFLNADPIGGIE